MPILSISLLPTGTISSREALTRQGGSWFKKATASIIAVLIHHTNGYFLFDTGFGHQIDQQVASNHWHLRRLFNYQKLTPAVDQLKSHGIQPQDIKGIILSHLHWDHASGLVDFPGVPVCTTSIEKDHALLHGRRPVFNQTQFSESILWKQFSFTPTPYLDFDTSYDFFGDGSLMLIPLPGHTPGSLGMIVTLVSGKKIFFIGDATWVLHKKIPTLRPLASRCLVDENTMQLKLTLQHIQKIPLAHPELIIVPAHDQMIHNVLGYYPQVII